MKEFVLKLNCPDQRGIVSAVSGFLSEQDCNIVESAHYCDDKNKRLFMRKVFVLGDNSPSPKSLPESFQAIGQRYDMEWELHDSDTKPKVLIMVSKFLHCLNDLLYRNSIGAIDMDITAIVSNHLDAKPLADFHKIPFHHLPMTKENKPEQEAKLMEISKKTKTELIVLARYMQILSPDLCKKLDGRAINIHHSFLPSFKGANPYLQAFDRGVKVIGATAHYVTTDLDEGPIIAQQTIPVTHANKSTELAAIGRDVESRVLADAVKKHCDNRVMRNGNKTVIFQ